MNLGFNSICSWLGHNLSHGLSPNLVGLNGAYRAGLGPTLKTHLLNEPGLVMGLGPRGRSWYEKFWPIAIPIQLGGWLTSGGFRGRFGDCFAKYMGHINGLLGCFCVPNLNLLKMLILCRINGLLN